LPGNKYNILLYDNNVENKRVKDSPSSSGDTKMDHIKIFRLMPGFTTQYFGRTCRKINIHLIKASFPLVVLVEF
jgi:hypothetical protein